MALLVMFDPGVRKIDKAALDMSHEAAKEIAAEIRANMNVDTGRLKRSIRVRRLKTSSRVYVEQAHWVFIEYGTSPHVIRAVRRKVLANRKTRQIFGKKVNHPGHRAYRPIRNAFYKKRSMVGKIMIRE